MDKVDKNKNITIVACYFGAKLGVGVFIEELLLRLLPLLEENDYQVSILTNENVLKNSPSLRRDNIKIYAPKELNKTISSKFYLLNKFAKTSYVKEAKYVLFMADTVLGKGIDNAISIVHDINEFEIHNKFGVVRTWFRKKMIKNVIAHASKIVVISDFVRNQLIKFFHESSVRRKTTVIYNGITFPSNNDPEYLAAFSKPYFIIVGRIDPKGKKMYEALKIFQAYKEQNNNYELKIVGAINEFCKKEASDFLTYATSLDGVSYLDYVDDLELNSLYKNAFATIFYSEYEGFGFPLLEAFARGCPVITNPNNKVNDELSQGYDIKVSEKDLESVEMICWKIDLVKQVNKEYLQMTARRFSWEQTALEYFNLLND